jgi:hypothetical protein
MDKVLYQLSVVEVASTVQEIEAVAKEDAKEEALSEAVETLLATTSRVGRKDKATFKRVDTAKQEKGAKRAKTTDSKGSKGDRGGRVGRKYLGIASILYK